MAIKILIGGSPCTYWSIAQTNNRETKAEGMGWELFKNYLIAKEKFKPDFFLYENNKSAAQAIKDQIAEEFGVGVDPNVRFTYINSALVSAQNRQRFYVTNFGDIEQPEDRGILLKDILETGQPRSEKSPCIDASYYKGGNLSNLCKQSGERLQVAEPVEPLTPFVENKLDAIVEKYGYLPEQFNPYNQSEITDKAPTQTAQCASQTKSSTVMMVQPIEDEMIPPCGQRNQEKARTLTSGYANKSQRDFRKDIETEGFMGAQGVVEPIYIGEVPEHKGTYRNGKQPSQQYHVYDTEGKGVSVTTSAITNIAEPVNVTPEGKSQTIKAQYQNTSVANVCCYHSTYGATGVAEPVNAAENGKSHTMKAQYYKNGIANFITNNGFDATAVAEPIRVGSLPRPNGELSTSQAMQIYSQEGKSTTQMAGGGGLGGKTGLYAIPVEFEDGIPTKAVSCADGKTYTVYEVKDGQITIKEKQYPIKLKDGYYIIRKLTVRECARLQTMPDDYCKAVSDSQAYKALGNGWTAEVIIHLLNHALKDIPRDEEIIVLSMYDGIATGRYCLDKMGFTNVKYHAYEIDKYPIMIAMDNYPDIVQHGDAFAVREDDWQPPQTRSEWLDSLLGGDL